MARRRRYEEPENHDRWLVSYADFITLLFAFFVVMYSISSVNDGKYRVLSETLESVFSQSTRSENPIQLGELSRGQGELTAAPGLPDFSVSDLELPELPAQPPSDLTTIEALSTQLNSALATLIDDEDVIIRQVGDWLEVEIKSSFLFASGDARLSRAAVPVMGQIADVLSPVANPIQVEGFTDNQPISTARFPSNWELSAARAASVVNLMDRFGVDPRRMSAVGYGEYKPIADNDTEQGRQKNRRVVLVVLGSDDSRRMLEMFDSSIENTDGTGSLETPLLQNDDQVSP